MQEGTILVSSRFKLYIGLYTYLIKLLYIVLFRFLMLRGKFAFIAQLVEQGTENPRVGGSIPSPGTFLLHMLIGIENLGKQGFVLFLLLGSGLFHSSLAIIF